MNKFKSIKELSYKLDLIRQERNKLLKVISIQQAQLKAVDKRIHNVQQSIRYSLQYKLF